MNALWKCHNTPFAWHENDCAMMVVNYLKETTGEDYGTEFRGKYNSAISAYRLVSKAGGLEQIVKDAGFSEVHMNFAKVGDVAVFTQPKRGITLGLVTQNRRIVIAGGNTFPIALANKIYRKGT